MNSISTYKYLVAEDERLIRRNLVKKITALQLPLTLVGEAANGEEAMRLTERDCPDIVITDIRMPQCDGLELARFLHQNHPGVKIMILSGYNDFSYAQAAIKFAVKDYLLKPVTMEALSESLQKLLMTMGTEADEWNTRHPNTLDPQAIYELLETYLQEHYQQDVSFQALGIKFGFTPEYLGRIFKRFSGETPLKYLTKLRMNEAKRLLANDQELEIHRVGELVGYKNAFYFSRAFKAYTGFQPSEFRSLAENRGDCETSAD